MADIAVALVDVNEHERLFNFTLKYKLKCKGTACSKEPSTDIDHSYP
jgi:hypothetical protein